MFIEFTKDHEIINRKKFKDWVLSARPKDVKELEIFFTQRMDMVGS